MKKLLALSLSDVVFIMLMNVKMPTIVGILTFMSRINFVLSQVEHEKSFITWGLTSRQECTIKNQYCYFSTKTYVLTDRKAKNHIVTDKKFCLSKPMVYGQIIVASWKIHTHSHAILPHTNIVGLY